MVTPKHVEDDQTGTVRPVLVDQKEEHKIDFRVPGLSHAVVKEAEHVKRKFHTQENSIKNGYDENDDNNMSDETKCETKCSINNEWKKHAQQAPHQARHQCRC